MAGRWAIAGAIAKILLPSQRFPDSPAPYWFHHEQPSPLTLSKGGGSVFALADISAIDASESGCSKRQLIELDEPPTLQRSIHIYVGIGSRQVK